MSLTGGEYPTRLYDAYDYKDPCIPKCGPKFTPYCKRVRKVSYALKQGTEIVKTTTPQYM